MTFSFQYGKRRVLKFVLLSIDRVYVQGTRHIRPDVRVPIF